MNQPRMLQAQDGKGLHFTGVAPCSLFREYSREPRRGVRFFPSWSFRKRPCSPLLWLAGLLLVPGVLGINCTLGIVPAAAEETAAPVEIDVTVEDGVLSANLRNARLGDVLRVIAERAGLRLKLAGDLRS